jgi:putative transposase
MMDKTPALATLSPAEREQALTRFQLLQPFLEGQTSLTNLAQGQTITLRTLQRWVTRYRAEGLVGLVRQRRSDQGQRRLDPAVQRLIEGLALQKAKPSAAAIHRQVAALAAQHGWDVPSYSRVYDIVHHLDPSLVLLAHEGSKAYQNVYDLVYRREATRPNEIWQADHTPLNLWLVDDDGQPAQPWLTVIEDDFSRCIAGYFLTFQAPTMANTALALRQAIWRKGDPRWRICGIPEVFYTDHGSDFTSQHMEQVCADIKSRLIFSTVGMPRGRGKIERFFQTVDQLLLLRLPGYVPEGGSLQRAVTPSTLTLADFDAIFLEFLLSEYHGRPQRDLPSPPQARWEAEGFLPHMPESLEQLDLLLLTVAKARRVRRDGIHFQNLRYLDPVLAAYVGEDVVIRYDPRDMAEIRVYHQEQFLCRALCQELAGQTISLKDIIRARNQRRLALKQEIKDRAELIQTYLRARQGAPAPSLPPPTDPAQAPPPARRLKLYENE